MMKSGNKSVNARPSVRYDSENITFREQVFNRIIEEAHKLNPNDPKRVKIRKLAFRYESCGTKYLVFKCDDCEKSFTGPNRCESRICPECSLKYTYRVREKQIDLIKLLTPTKRKRLMFLTVTKKVKNKTFPTEKDYKSLFKAFRKLINKFYPKKYGCGGFAVIEIGDGYNIHIHAIVYGYFIPQSKISKEWEKITKDSKVVDIRETRSPIKYLNYLLKYIHKPPKSNDPKFVADYLISLMGVRRIHTYGIFYNYPLLKKKPYPCYYCSGKLELHKITNEFELSKDVIKFSDLNKIIN